MNAFSLNSIGERLANVLAMCERLTEAVEGDIAALEKGALDRLRTTDPEIERLSLLYGREVLALKTGGGIKDAPADLKAALRAEGARLKQALLRHEKLIECMRLASEGLVKTVADEVHRIRTQGAPYSATPKPPRAVSGAIVYNRVI